MSDDHYDDATIPPTSPIDEAATLPPERGAQESAPRAPAAGAEDATLPAGDLQVGTPQPGAKVRYFGDYELLEEIARGGMGVVYKARQVSLNRIVALKMILAGQLAGEDEVKRFYTEAEATAKLDHPGIVPIFEIGQHEGQHYFSMGYVEGMSLAKKVADGPLPPREAAELVAKIAAAVQYAHQQGVIHRDLKPGNILLSVVRGQSSVAGNSTAKTTDHGQLTTDVFPKVTDFGLAKQLQADSGLTGTGQILGTPSYMPPEQAAGKIDEIGPAADVYALGAILYCLLTGRPPFQSASPMDTLLAVLDQEPVPLRQLNPKVPQDLETICLKCLEKDQRRRYESAVALAVELQRFLNGEPVLARPAGAPERLWRWCRRRPALAAAGGLALASTIAALVILSVSVVLVSNSRNEEKTARVKETEQRQRAEQQLRRSEGLLYASQVDSALREWETNNVDSAWQYLNACHGDLRGWEYDYLYTLFNQNQETLKGHTGFENSVAFSPDGKRIASGSGDQALKVWDATSGQETLTLKALTGVVSSVAFNLTAQRLGWSLTADRAR